ncbi:conserved hypothetical protein [Glaciecola punicea ACAM 611]|jgi:hypothetical protein|uniref:DUF2956 domain-containing protein n=1 Tax=Glaciecola punicea ACAM 611 TaxID=1121923 RepID=H5T7M5_9ALTE|nr:DUF2956 domain-containing protein [Glaciecola punicea]OFA32920.1 hypothetical protein BAE46_04040 [Glaciecola punicea]GAB54302.1 conserved hypothetical protein [Glaciecola punicea ACAM 611]
MKNKVSPEVEDKAIKLAKGTQKAGQTKVQTKLIAQGIEKGIGEYKKQQGRKLREIDKKRKQEMKRRESEQENLESREESPKNNYLKFIPWALLALSWLGFAVYIAL